MMNIRGKSSPVQSNIRNIPNQQTRGQTPPPQSQLRGHFEEAPQYHTHFQPAGGPYHHQQQQAYLDMNKSAPGRVPGQPGLGQPHQGFNMPRGGPQNYPMVGDSQDQATPQMWNQGQFYQLQAPNQNMRQQRMPMNNNQMAAYLPGMAGSMPNMAIFPGNMATAGYSGNQAMPFMQNNQFMYSQPRMPFAAPMPQQQQQMGFMPQYGPTSTGYATPTYFGQPPMALPATSRPATTGPQGAMGGPAHRPPRSRKMLSLTDPNTGEDLTEKVFKPAAGEDADPSGGETRAHRVALEFATKVAFLAKDKNQPPEEQREVQMAVPPPQQQQQHGLPMDIPPPPPIMPPPHGVPEGPPRPPASLVGAPAGPPVMNGEADGGSIAPPPLSLQHPPPPFAAPPPPTAAPAKPQDFQPAADSVVAAAVAEVHTPSPAQPSAAPLMSDMAPAPAVAAPSQPAKKEASPPASKEPSPPPRVVDTAAPPHVEQRETEEEEAPAPTPPAPSAPAPPGPVAQVLTPAPAPPVMPAPAAVTSPTPGLLPDPVPAPVVAQAPASTPAPAPVTLTAAPVPGAGLLPDPVPAPVLPPAAVETEAPAPAVKEALVETPMQAAGGCAAEAPKAASDAAPVPLQQREGAQATREAQAQLQDQQQAASQNQAAAQPQPQRSDGKKSNRKHRRDLNKKNKDGNDMDAYLDSEGSKQDSAAAAATAAAAAEYSAKPAPVSSSPSPGPSTTPPPPPLATTEAKVPAAASQVETGPEASSTPVADSKEVVVREPTELTEASAAEPQAAGDGKEQSPEASAPSPSPSPAPGPEAEEEAVSEDAAKLEGAVEGAVGGADAAQNENGEVVDADVYDKLLSELGITCREGQWSPMNPEGKKQYDREFLLKLRGNPESRKAPTLPNMPEIIVDPKLARTENLRMMSQMPNIVDFTPNFFKSFPGGNRNTPSMTKRNSQQRGRGGGASQSGEQRIIIARQEIRLHKSENAYKPLFQAGPPKVADTEQETQDILRKFQGILNKLTPEKFTKLGAQALELKINTEERLIGIANLIFEKAISEQKFASVYAELCNLLQKLPKIVPEADEKKEEKRKEVTFRGVLLTKCQREFEKDKEAEKSLENMELQMIKENQGTLTEEKKKAMRDELTALTKKARHRTLGNIKFIGELFRLKMLTENIMHDCIFKLLKLRDDDSIECLTKLLGVVGKDLDHLRARQRMDQYFAQLEKMVECMRNPQGAPASSKDKLSSRVRFFILDILDMRSNGWNKRKIHDQNNPTTIGALHIQVKQEEQAQQYLNNQPRQEPAGARGGARPKGRGSAQGDTEGWNTVPTRPVKQQIDAARMKITKTNVDVNNVTLGGGNKFRNWGQGSQGGGSRSQEQEKQGNRYNALNNLNDNDGRRNYGRSPARDSRGSSSRMDRDRDLDRRDRDRDFRKPVSRSSIEERDRAVNTTRNLLGAGAVGGSSNPSSRNTSRDNSRSRDTPPAAASGPDASKMSYEELNRRINTIAEEFISNDNMKDTQESIAELRNLDYSMLVTTLVEKLIEKAGTARKMLGQLLMQMIHDRQLSVEHLINGLKEFLQFAEDLELDVPRIWDYLGEVMGGLLVDNKVLPLTFLQACVAPLLEQGNNKHVGLVSRSLTKAAEYKSKEIIQTQWLASGLRLSDFGLNEEDFKWLKGLPRNMVHQEVFHRLRRKENEKVFEWIEGNTTVEDRMSSQFVREFFSAIVRHVIIGNGSDQEKVNIEEVKHRVPLVRKYVNTREKGTQALFGIQHLLCELQHPQGLAGRLFEMCYDEDIIMEDSFYDWEKRDVAVEDNVGRGVVKMGTKDFFNWLKTSVEEERTS